MFYKYVDTDSGGSTLGQGGTCPQIHFFPQIQKLAGKM